MASKAVKPKDPTKAAKWRKELAAKILVEHGEELPENGKGSEETFQKAIKDADLEAEFNLKLKQAQDAWKASLAAPAAAV